MSGRVSDLEEWLYQHNMRLGIMTHSLQAIAQENANLTQQRKNNEELQTTVRVRIERFLCGGC